MKNFNWEEFKNGEIAVHCDTEEKANNFLNECDKQGIAWADGDKTTEINCWLLYKKNTSYVCSFEKSKLEFGFLEYNKDKGLEIIKWEIDKMKELTFKEVIENIKEGEVWESTVKTVSLINGAINIERKNEIETYYIYIKESELFKLQRKEYTFQEAFKAYEEGKEIESCYTATKFCENEYLENNVYADWKLGVRFKVDEIKGKWYINEED
ncbi:hypothetical protein [Clostridium tertium]|uniref:hypothetical protein n=1 Tax=Clostridium tertium TaxID=1559 RepID=UPI001AE38788|nr:hypothetical protein [Clostridium tertium]MBP1869358.1 hypothetical protein [Clostridium tertium]